MPNNSSFQINNITLNISPQKIRVDRQSFNNIYQTLRTQSSIKSKSGFSTIDVYLTIEFTNDTPLDSSIGSKNGFQQLRDLISQFRCTPFCYVENSFLRNKILSGNTNQSMAFALKQIEITKGNNPSEVNVITVNLQLCWFNFFPFTRDFSYRQNIMGITSTKDPANSAPWHLMYLAEQNRHNYKIVDNLQTGLVFSFPEYKALTIKRYREIKDKEVKALKTLNRELNQLTSNKEGSAILDTVKNTLYKELQDQYWARSLRREIFGDTTSMFFDENTKNVLNKVKNVLKQTLSPETRDKRFATSEFGWRPIILADGSFITLSEKPSDKGNPDSLSAYNEEETILLVRERYLDFNDEGLIVQGISISFENILAVLPLIGHPYPTYQHIGSVDARVSFSIAALDEKSIAKLSAFYSSVEEQHHKYRNIPSGFRNIKIENDIVNMCGLEQFLPEAINVETIEGEPGTYSAIVTLLDNPLTPETQEKIGAGQSFTSSIDIRLKVAEIIEKNLKFNNSLFSINDIPGENTFFNTVIAHRTININEPLSVAPTIDNAKSSYYSYSGSKSEKSRAFASLCGEYAKKLSYICEYLLFYLKFFEKEYIGLQLVQDLSELRNNNIIGIERINNDLSEVYQVIKDIPFIRGAQLGSAVYGNIEEALPRQDIIDAKNELEEIKSLTGDIVGNIAPDLVSEITGKDKDRELIRLQGLTNKTFGEWLSFVNPFIDGILNDSNLLAMPEFESVRNIIKENRAPLIASDCYPDFPLPQVVSLMEQDDELSPYLKDGLIAAWDSMGLGLKNVGLSSLLNPDFYFFNSSNDVIDEIIPYHIINKAKDSILQSRDVMKSAEGDWFKNVYEENILGREKQANLSDIFSNLFSSKVFQGDDAPLKSYSAKYQQHLDEYGTVPDGLQGSVYSSLNQVQQSNDGRSINVETIGYAKAPSEEGVRSKSDSQNVYLNYRNGTTMNPIPDSNNIKHRFGTEDALSFLSESEYMPPAKSDPSKDPVFIPPTPTTARRITSPFGKRLDPVKSQNGVEKTVKHNGIDIAGNKPADSYLTPIYAAADGKIVYVTKDLWDAQTHGVGIRIEHANGWMTIYHHLVWDEEFVIPFSDTLNRGKDFGLSNSSSEQFLTVRAGDQIGYMDNTGYSTGSHLHFAMKFNGTFIDPIGEGIFTISKRGKATYISGIGEGRSQGPIAGIDPENESLLYKSVQQFEKDLKNGMGYGMMRAYPTFKLYFIESDLGERKRYAFDDFFAYNSVQEIQVIRHRKIAADLCVIQLTNISGSLNNRKFIDAEDPTLARGKDGQVIEENEEDISAVNTIKENPIASLMLQSGTQVQLRLGFCVDDKTEILSQRGWLTQDKLTEDDVVLTLNHDTGLSEWNKVEKVNRFNVRDREMIHLDKRFHSSLTTLNHKWPVQTRRGTMKNGKVTYSKEREWRTSEELKSYDYLFGAAKCSDLPKVKKWDDSVVELVGWFWTEGNIGNNKPGRNPTVIISQSKKKNPDKIKLIENALIRCFGPASQRLSNHGRSKMKPPAMWLKRERATRDEVCFRLNTEASKLFLELSPDKVPSEYFIKNLTQEQLDLFIQISNKGDGHYSNRESFPIIVSQKDPRGLKSLELAAILAGYRTHIRKGSYLSTNKKGEEYPMTILTISNKETIGLECLANIGPKRILYTGTIWCPTTKNHTWLARRDGHVYYTGNSNNPEELETVFNGIIVDHEFSDSTDLVTIICQSFAIELVQTIQGEDKSFGGWFSDDGRTWQILNEVLAAPEVVHFGRWEPGGFGANKQRGLLQNRWRFKPNPTDDNLFPPQGSGPLGIVDYLLKLSTGHVEMSKKYIMYNTTIWDVIQELTLRHPGYIASPVPYESEYGPRMTLFFGLPDQLYFARDATQTENQVINKLKDVVKEGSFDNYSEKAREMIEDATQELGKVEAKKLDSAIKRVENSQSDEEIEIWLKKISKLFAQARGFIKPFRNYHVATSSLHILHNSIASSGHNTFNTVTLQYSDDGPEFDEDTAELNFNDPETLTLKADAGIPDEQIREMFAQYPNCNGYEMAKLYSVSLLYNSLKEAYGGSLVLIGNPRIKPMDIVYLFDEYNDMYGPVEVEKVVHKFSQKNGFITEITPDLCVHVNQESTLSTQDAMGLIAEHGLRQIGMESLGTISKSLATINDTISPLSSFGFSPLSRMFFNKNENQPSYNQDTSIFGSIGLFIFRKLITRTQLAHPFRFSPLVLSGKPMIGGLPNRYTDGSFIQSIGDWFKETSESIPLLLQDTYDRFKANYWFGHSEGDFDSVIFGDDQE